jgi:hypothetical protein
MIASHNADDATGKILDGTSNNRVERPFECPPRYVVDRPRLVESVSSLMQQAAVGLLDAAIVSNPPHR